MWLGAHATVDAWGTQAFVNVFIANPAIDLAQSIIGGVGGDRCRVTEAVRVARRTLAPEHAVRYRFIIQRIDATPANARIVCAVVCVIAAVESLVSGSTGALPYFDFDAVIGAWVSTSAAVLARAGRALVYIQLAVMACKTIEA
jgi:hypothetical protein